MTKSELALTRQVHEIVEESPSITEEGIVEDSERRADTYRQGDHHGVAVVDRFGAKVTVERGHLGELHDGVPDLTAG